MRFKSLYVTVAGSGIAACGAAVFFFFRSADILTDPGEGAIIVSFIAVLTLFALAAAYQFGSHIDSQISRIISYLKQRSGSAISDTPPISFPVSFNEIGRLTATLNRLARKLRDESRKNEEAREQMKMIDEEKSHFLATVSHELRTPLNTILGFTQLLVDGTEGELSDSQRENIKIIGHSGQNLLSLINDILDLSELESGRLQIEPRKVSLEELIRTTVKEVSGQIKRKRATIIADIEQPPPPVYADPKRVYQVLMNLLNNAVKFTPKGEIVVKTREAGDFVEVEVKDAGYGISPNDLPYIFLEFKQVGNLKSRRKGSGLGLAICKRLVEFQGGTISVQSTPGKGSTFTFTLPVFRDRNDALKKPREGGERKEPEDRDDEEEESTLE
ncbi:MAG: HAMP domain-containing sensor histidine kinase [Pseudomonadota bacterium]